MFGFVGDEGAAYRCGKLVHLKMLPDGGVREEAWYEGVARVVGNVAHSATRVFRPRYKVVEVDTDRGSVVVKEQRWSWRRWCWEAV